MKFIEEQQELESEIYRLRDQGWTELEISRELCIYPSTIRAVLRRRNKDDQPSQQQSKETKKETKRKSPTPQRITEKALLEEFKESPEINYAKRLRRLGVPRQAIRALVEQKQNSEE